jgi:hypothetical protein
VQAFPVAQQGQSAVRQVLRVLQGQHYMGGLGLVFFGLGRKPGVRIIRVGGMLRGLAVLMW